MTGLSDYVLNGSLSEQAVLSPRFGTLGRIGTDLTTIGSWDVALPRHDRILVPADVQAYVVPASGTEATVEVAGNKDDPPPFSAGATKPTGVHLHWAMPDALLSGGHDTTTGALVMPVLPDRWTVVRTLQPNGSRQVIASGWVVDSPTKTVWALADYTGQTGAGTPITPFDGTGGGPAWTASYDGANGRFTFHDPLTDLAGLAASAPNGFAGDQAAYTVAGWWSDPANDPLATAAGPAALDDALATLGWHVDHEQDDSATLSKDPRVARLNTMLGLATPSDQPKANVVGNDGRTVTRTTGDIAFQTGFPVDRVASVSIGPAMPTYDSMLHGSVLGVPLTAALPAADDRPDPANVGVSLGTDIEGVLAAFGAAGLGIDPSHRGTAETLVSAFAAGTVASLGSTDGLDDLAEREHVMGFWGLAGAALSSARADRVRVEDTLPAGPLTVGRKGRAAAAAATGTPRDATTLRWAKTTTLREGSLVRRTGAGANPRIEEVGKSTSGGAAKTRQVDRPAPRYFRPQPLLLALRGVHPNHRHHGDGLYDDRGKLLCRYPSAVVSTLDAVVDGATVLPSLGSGAVPAEVLLVVREAVLLNPYGHDWLVAAGAPPEGVLPQVTARVQAEMVRLYGVDGSYDGTGHVEFTEPKAANASSWQSLRDSDQATRLQVASDLARFSVVRGTPPSPVAITTWRQPWVPLWVEWKVTLEGAASVAGWKLDGLDLERDTTTPTPAPLTTTLLGRSMLGLGAGETLRSAVTAWLYAEYQRLATVGSASYGDPTTLQALANLTAPLDLVSASLDGIREQLLGIDYVGVVARGSDGRPVASGAPTPLFGGTLRLDALRLVDAFGRTLDVPDAALDATSTTEELEVTGVPRTITMRPRLQGSARLLWRLVDPRQPTGTPSASLNEAFVDQVDPGGAVNPVAGFLLPDHIDEGLETFTVTGDPIGEINHDAITGAVTWETAPGRPLPPDAGPLAGLGAQESLVGALAAGMVAADAAARALPSPPAYSALVTFLRAVDSTLWTVDTLTGLGTASVAGLVGRPIAVVRTTLSLDAPDDVAEVDITAGGGADARRAGFDALDKEQFEVALGTLTRSDDTVLGYFVDDDYAHFHVVDRVIAANAFSTGRNQGQLGLLGQSADLLPEGLDHPYLSPDSTVPLRRGQTVMLTVLMLPNGRAHLTSGVLPRKELALADSWVTPGLTKLMPSVRVGPVLVDPAEIRLPLVDLLGDKQTFTRRTGPLTWKDDPILAATQTAYLPRLPHHAQEGWIRVTPDDGSAQGTPS
jgi:hypothetical protein